MKKLITLFVIVFLSQILIAQTIKQRLDSIANQDFYEGAWLTTNAYVYKYDVIGNQTQEKYLFLNEDGGMDIWKQTDYSYYPDHTLSQLILSAIDEYNYPDVTEAYKENIEYNADRLIDQKIISYKNPITLQWELDKKINYEYDEFKNLIIQVDSGSTGCTPPEWEPSRRNEYTYNTNNDLLIQLESDYSSSDEQWIANYKYEYFYNEDGELIQELRFTKFGLPDWEEERKFDYEYDDSGNRIQIIYSSFSELNTWLVTDKIELSYDVWNNMTQYIGYSWDDNQWNKAYKYDWEMNTNYAYNELILPYFDDGEDIIDDGIGLHPIGTFEHCFKHMLNESFNYKWHDESWSNINHSSFHYSELNMGITEIFENPIHLYPNPTNDFIILESINNDQKSIVEIYDTKGLLILSEELPKDRKISLSSLKNGIYIYKLITKARVFSGKIIKQ